MLNLAVCRNKTYLWNFFLQARAKERLVKATKALCLVVDNFRFYNETK